MRDFSKNSLLELAGQTSYERGTDYVSRVRGLTVDGATVRGTVTGTSVYRVELTPGRNGLDWDCTCPWAADGNFCKHCVAVGLVHLFNLEHGLPTPEAPDPRSYLRSRNRDELLALLLEAVDTFPGLRRRVELRAAASGAGTGDVDTLRALIEDTLRVGESEYMEYDRVRAYAVAAHGVADELAELLERGLSAQVAELSRHAIALLEEQVDMIDDSAGHVDGAVHRFDGIHAEACSAAGRGPGL